MFIESIKVKNYKSFSDFEMICNENFNIIIGENNIGKSSLFEALLLWKQCYDCVTKANKKGFYSAKSSRYLRFDDLEFLRVTSDADLYQNPKKPITIAVTINHKGISYDLGFQVDSPKNPKNSYFRISFIKHAEFEKFCSAFEGKVSEAIFIYKTQPISSIPSNEPYMNKGQVLKKISKGKSYEVLRNKIIDTKQNFTTHLSNVLEQDIDIRTMTSKSNDEYINLQISIGNETKELHLQGSGLLQIAEIFSSIDYIESALNIVLLDEPDSHIHTKLLSNLIRTLKGYDNENNQIFIISHNEKFIDHSENENGSLYFMNRKLKESNHFKLTPIEKSAKFYMKSELGSITTTLDLLNSVDKVIFVEGSGDEKFWDSLLNIYKGIQKDKGIYYFINTEGKDGLKSKVHNFLRMLKPILNINSVGIIFDKDFTPMEKHKGEKRNLKKMLKSYNHFVCSYEGYCLESSYFSQIDLISRIISNITNVNEIEISKFITEYLDKFKEELKTVNSNIYIKLRGSFESQKINREEINDLDFDTVIQDLLRYEMHYSLNKDQVNIMLNQMIEKFNIEPEKKLNPHTIKIQYLRNIKSKDDIFKTHLNVLQSITHNIIEE
ncbi:hypothetical protein EH196_00485 [Bacillus sp. C1-1]|nr:hypothetical protein EH196_00485 [Bacillus sp. C1-1]